MYSDRSHRRLVPLSLAITISLAVGSVGWAGHDALSPEGPVFVPPFVPPVDTTTTTTASDSAAAKSAEAAVAASATQIGLANQFCAALPDEYAIDCMGERLGAIAADLPDTPETAEVRQILTDTSRKLEAVAKSNRNPAKPRVRASGGTTSVPIATTRPLTPVKPEVQADATAQAVAILQEAETQLLRSSSASDARTLSYVEVAQALDSSAKVLLRS